MRKVAQDRLFGSLQLLNAALDANASDLPEMELNRQRFEALVVQMQETAKLQAAQAAAKQETTRQLQTLMREAKQIANILRLGVKARYGTRAEKLIEFGLKPFRGRKVEPKPVLVEPGPAAE